MILNQGRKMILNPVGSFSFKKYDGTSAVYSISSLWNHIVVKVGTGNTPPTADDFNLEIPSNLTVNGTTENVCGENNPVNKYSRMATVATTYTNATEDSITITEIGMLGGNAVYITRELLETPVTIKPGESYTFTAVIDIK